MKRRILEMLMAVGMGLAVPMMIVSCVGGKYVSEFPAAETDPNQQISEAIMVDVLMSDGIVTRMDMGEYLTGVLLAEMPASFEIEALKAQAVVARTYALKRMETGKKHSNGSVCTNPACCQAYVGADEYLSRGNDEKWVTRVRSAVSDTAGLALFYNGKYIEATYFSCSGGRTEDAVAVWGSEIPYLQAVDSPGEEIAEHYTDTVVFTADDFLMMLGLDNAHYVSIGNVTYTDGGGVKTITINGSEFQGTAVRTMLGLRSTAFIMTSVGQSITVTTKGFGHRVGMSQYGAQAMALAGKTHDEILAYYYRGTTLMAVTKN